MLSVLLVKDYVREKDGALRVISHRLFEHNPLSDVRYDLTVGTFNES